jgi:hypothetical protein
LNRSTLNLNFRLFDVRGKWRPQFGVDGTLRELQQGFYQLIFHAVHIAKFIDQKVIEFFGC